MRCFGEWRRAAIALGLAAGLGTGLSDSADAGIFFHTLPRVAPAYDYGTGGEYFAPPVPYGHYAKDPVGELAKGAGHVGATAHGLMNHLGDSAHGLIGDLAGMGHGLGHGYGPGCADGSCGHGIGHGLGGNGCGLGCGLGGGGGIGHGLGGIGHGLGCGLAGCGLGGGGIGHVHSHGSGINRDPCRTTVAAVARPVKNFGPIHPAGQTAASPQAVVLPTSQHVVGTAIGDPCSACGGGGCGLCGGSGLLSRLGGGLGHGIGNGLAGKLKCHLCGGRGCGGCGGAGFGDPCSSCRGGGCGLCNGSGLLSRLKQCMFCGGAGCKHCLGGHGLKGKLHGMLGGIMGPKFDYFVGAGGPVPLTPGYVPYIVTTRSPRDFFAFPPRTPDGF